MAKKEVVVVPGAPPPRPGRASAVRFGNLLFLSGQVPRDAQDNRVTGDIKTQARAVFENLEAVLEGGGSSIENVLKMQVYLRDIKRDYEAFNEAFYEYFKVNPVARTCVQAAEFAGPGDVEIDLIAGIPD